MNSNSSPPPAASQSPGETHNARLGLVLFFIYCLFYVGFIILSAFGHELMGRPVWGGVNLAVVYGFGLIVAAFVLALVYMVLCAPTPAAVPEITEGELADEAQKEEGSA